MDAMNPAGFRRHHEALMPQKEARNLLISLQGSFYEPVLGWGKDAEFIPHPFYSAARTERTRHSTFFNTGISAVIVDAFKILRLYPVPRHPQVGIEL